MGKVIGEYGFTKILQYGDGSIGKIINPPDEPGFSLHIHHHPNGVTISSYDRRSGQPLLGPGGEEQRFTWPNK